MATAEGTKRFVERVGAAAHPAHFREVRDLRLSSIGLGTYLGGADAATDQRYEDAVVAAVERGCNVIDTAINYRFQRSERAIGKAVARIGADRRDELFLSTKAGFIPFNGRRPDDPAEYFKETYVDPGVATPADVVAGMHCMTPKYLEHELECSRANLGVAAIDLFYLHNPETQLGEVPREEFRRRVRAAFEMLEGKVQGGAIRLYGVATWHGFRRPPAAHDFVSLEDLVAVAREVAGDGHHFRAVQLPYNLAMPEAALEENQPLGGRATTLLRAAAELGVKVFSSASILQGQLAERIPAAVDLRFPELKTKALRALQFVRSTPGLAVALVGMSRAAHVEENLSLAKVAPADLSDVLHP